MRSRATANAVNPTAVKPQPATASTYWFCSTTNATKWIGWEIPRTTAAQVGSTRARRRATASRTIPRMWPGTHTPSAVAVTGELSMAEVIETIVAGSTPARPAATVTRSLPATAPAIVPNARTLTVVATVASTGAPRRAR